MHYDTQLEGKSRMVSSLRECIQQDKLTIVYQPIVNLKTNAVSLESLARWKFEDNWISPDVFIPMVEEIGLIDNLTRQIADKVIQDWHFWKEELPELTHISLNISPMMKGEYALIFLDVLQEDLTMKGIPTHQICFEITEGVLIDQSMKRFIERSTALGFVVAVDDFGTGYSSLSYLANYAFDVLKIDRSFVKNLVTNTKQQIIARAIVEMAKQLNIQVVAEGVETKEQMHLLKQMGADAVQGYYFSKPQLVNEWNPLCLNEKRRMLQIE